MSESKEAPIESDYSCSFLQNALKQEVLSHMVTQKADACPMGVRLAWHSSGTYDKSDASGGSNGATMRFPPESTDGANAGLGIMRDMLLPVQKKFPNVSVSDIWAMAGKAAVEKSGGPEIHIELGRTDKDASFCPANGRLPDASLGEAHLRDVFYRMGFNDQEIVALSGAHTLGRCHQSRSGFDGPWTKDPLKFDNTYFTNLLELEWKPREWDGPLQYEDPSGTLMMLPTDIALIQDESFKEWVVKYAADSDLFSKDFAAAFSKLLGLGVTPKKEEGAKDSKASLSAVFREHAMHGSLEHMKKAVELGANVHEVEKNSARSALHKAAFWGHEHLVTWFVDDLGLDVNSQDFNGDTPLHDAARFGHVGVAKKLLYKGADKTVVNREGHTAADVAKEYGKTEILEVL